MMHIFKHPFSLILASPSNGGKSTLVYNIIKNSKDVVEHTNGKGFDSVWVLYRSYQPLYDRMKQELHIPVYLFEKTLPADLETLLSRTHSKFPVVIVDDGLCPENQDLVLDLFCRLGHHLAVSVILITQSIFDCKNPGLRICHRNTKNLIIFGCPRDQGSLRTLIHQMIPDHKKAKLLLETIEQELEKPYRYVLFDYNPMCPVSQRYKTNILCENEPHPIALTFQSYKKPDNTHHNFSLW